jgi:hypothetical protein
MSTTEAALRDRAEPLPVITQVAALRASGFPYIAIGILVLLALVAIFANVITPFDPRWGAWAIASSPPPGRWGAAPPISSARTTSGATSSRG